MRPKLCQILHILVTVCLFKQLQQYDVTVGVSPEFSCLRSRLHTSFALQNLDFAAIHAQIADFDIGSYLIDGDLHVGRLVVKLAANVDVRCKKKVRNVSLFIRSLARIYQPGATHHQFSFRHAHAHNHTHTHTHTHTHRAHLPRQTDRHRSPACTHTYTHTLTHTHAHTHTHTHLPARPWPCPR